jgi:hypothetical protein
MAHQPSIAIVPLKTRDGYVIPRISLTADGTLSICVIVLTNTSDDLVILRTTYTPLRDGSGDYGARHDAASMSTVIRTGEETPPESMSSEGTLSEDPAPGIPGGPPDI